MCPDYTESEPETENEPIAENPTEESTPRYVNETEPDNETTEHEPAPEDETTEISAEQPETEAEPSRRGFLQATGAAASVAALGGAGAADVAS
ncbi:hypothetical protein BRC86_13015, partial [Halobacteriales archaeon QS_3_64_16]